MVGPFLFTVCAIVLLKRAGVSAGWTAAIPALLAAATMMGLLVVAPGYLQSLAAGSSGRAAIASSVGVEIPAALSLTWMVRKKV
jgi:hypothetical protein